MWSALSRTCNAVRLAVRRLVHPRLLGIYSYRPARNTSRSRVQLSLLLLLLLSLSPHSPTPLSRTAKTPPTMLGEYNSAPMPTTPANYTKDCINDGASPLGLTARCYPRFSPTATGSPLMHQSSAVRGGLLEQPRAGLHAHQRQPSVQQDSFLCYGPAEFYTCAYSATPSSSNIVVPDGACVRRRQQSAVRGGRQQQPRAGVQYQTITNGMAASYELGQPNATAFTARRAATSQSGLGLPNGLAAADLAFDSVHEYLYVVDGGNNRVMVFNVAPSYLSGGTGGSCSSGSYGNGENACYVLGQSSWTANTAATSQSGFNCPTGVAVDTTNNWAYVSDGDNNRVMVFPDLQPRQ